MASLAIATSPDERGLPKHRLRPLQSGIDRTTCFVREVSMYWHLCASHALFVVRVPLLSQQ